MSSQSNDLIKMRDIDTLFELMTEDDNWMTQLDAAEGLVKLGDRRGYEFLLNATQRDDEDMQQVAREILDTPELAKMNAEIEAEQKREHQALIVGLTGCPLVTEHALSVLEAQVISDIDLGTHTIFIGDTISSEVIKAGRPLTYQFYHENLKGKSPPAAPTFNAGA